MGNAGPREDTKLTRRNARRRPAFLVFVIAALVGVVGAAFADSYEPVLPPFPDPRFTDPQLLVTPSDNLVSGQTVQVTGRRFGANTTGGTLQQCTADLTLCESPTGSFTTGSNGEFNPINAPNTPEDPQTIPVPFVVRSAFVATNGTPVNCLVTPCVIFATVTTGGETRSAAHHISFQGAVTTTSSTSTTVAPTTTSSTVAPTTTSNVAPTTTSTVAPTTTSTVAPTTTSTVAPTTTSTSTTVAPTTTVGPTTTTSAPTASACDLLRARRAAINAELDAAKAASPSQSAQIEAYRTLVNTRIDQELAARGCLNGA